MVRGQNVNWVRDLVMETSFERVGDSPWFYKSASLYADFSVVAAADSTKLLSLIGRRNILYSNPRFEGVVSDDSRPITTMEQGYQSRDEAYWDSVRPYALTQKEKNIYKMVDKIQEQLEFQAYMKKQLLCLCYIGDCYGEIIKFC